MKSFFQLPLKLVSYFTKKIKFNSLSIGKDLMLGMKYFDNSEFYLAFEVLQKYIQTSPDENDSESYSLVLGSIKYHLGYMLYYGLGTTKNRALSDKMFVQAARLGSEDAQAYLYKHETSDVE